MGDPTGSAPLMCWGTEDFGMGWNSFLRVSAEADQSTIAGIKEIHLDCGVQHRNSKEKHLQEQKTYNAVGEHWNTDPGELPLTASKLMGKKTAVKLCNL